MKRKLTLSIDEETLNQAKQFQINLSSFLEIRLVDYFMAKKCSRWDYNTNLLLKNSVFLILILFLFIKIFSQILFF
jgi:hypothetical protein